MYSCAFHESLVIHESDSNNVISWVSREDDIFNKSGFQAC